MGNTEILVWTIVSTAVFAVLGGVLTMTPPDYSVQRVLFSLAAIYLMGLAARLSLLPGWPLWVRLIGAFVVFGGIGCGWVKSFDWLSGRENTNVISSPLVTQADKSAEKIESQKAIQPFSWAWNLLTAEQTSQIVSKLFAEGRPDTVTVSAVATGGANLAGNLDEAFGRAKWGHFMRGSAPAIELIENIVVGPDSASARIIKDALESAGLPVTIRNLKMMAKDASPDVIVGVKPVPFPLTSVLLNETKELGQKLKDISSDILAFAADRVREEGLLPPRQSYSQDISGISKMHQRGAAFSQETHALYNMKFGNRATPYLAQLQTMGIILPLSLQRSESRHAGLGKWFATVGDLLVQGQIQEARTVGKIGRAHV